ncbi:multidrug resistance-associated protein 5-like isoform X1 [Leptopilina heterotoma]|uniref:multidrug resistance-associated protein 5-like isoform X1 n=1 Tax=Leptopilina heterotoma TaxID=63436 RepID=UPI001CA8E907|nr:multidrug resistance-associated protein 5-like isoform X1 [Leptopilina heterotoma]
MPDNGNTEEDEIESEQMLDQRITDSRQTTQEPTKQTIKYVPGRGSTRYNNALQNLIPLRPNVKEKEKPPEDNVGLFSFLYLTWFTKYLWKAYRKGIDKNDLPNTSIFNSCAYNSQRLEILWKEELGRRGSDGASFTLVAWRFARTRIFLSCILYGCSVIFGFLSPAILMRKVLEFLQENDESYANGIKWALLLILCEICRLTLMNWSWNMNVTTARRLKSACLSLLYKKVIGLNSLGNKSTGELINVFSSDGQKAFDLMLYGPQIVGGPVATICGIIYILFTLSPMALLGMIVFSLFYILQYLLTRITKYYKSRCLKVTDRRIKIISDILESIKLIKLNAQENFIATEVSRIRQDERKLLSKLAFFDSTTFSLTPTVTIIATIVTFLAHLYAEDNLTVAQAFPILSIIVIVLSHTTFEFKDGSKDYKPARIAFSNFKSVLLLEETNCHISKPIVRSQAISILNGKFVYDNFETRQSVNSVDKEIKPKKKKSKRLIIEKRRIEILSEITFEAGKRQLIGICGHVGSGKSSLLLASLGQLRMISGQAMRNGSCAYVGQQAWIINATFKENVIFGEIFDPKRYYRALSICSLKEDINMLPSGDETEIGERGVNLSGGQKQRLALARAFYANRDIYFLDDPLSAVDSNVGLYIFENLILNALRDKTILFVTHQMQYLNRCDDIYMMYNGRIIEHGKHEELMHADKEYAAMVKNVFVESQDSSPEEDQETEGEEGGEEDEESDTEEATNVKSEQNRRNSPERENFFDDKTIKTDGTGKSLMTKGNIKGKTISAHTFHVYIKAAGGYFLFLLLCLAFLLNIGSITFSSCWLAYWLKEGGGATNITIGKNETMKSININENPDFNYYETIYASCILIVLFTSLIRAFAITGVTMKAASTLHRQLFSKMIGSSIRFFETTPSGEIQNLFSTDINVVDNGMRISLEMFLQTIFTCIFTIFIICFVLPWFIIPLIFLAGLFYFVGKIFRVSMRDLKRLENASRSPVFSFITATTQGLNTIRAFNKEQEFILKFQELLDQSCAYEYFRNLASRWLAIRFDLLSLFSTSIVLLFVICFKDHLSPAFAGLALVFVAQTTGLFQFSLRNFSDLEARFTNVERISCFLRTMKSENKLKVTITPTEEWPTQGTIEFKNVRMKYDENLPFVLNDISFSINDAEKIGIVGRTGGGKSSLVNAIFRLCELSEGKIMVDGIDISKIDLELLRSKLFNVPQDLVLFGGTIRSHVDPFEQFTDEEIWSALEKSRLKDRVASMPGLLAEPVKSGGSNLSMGEKQLLCLTRAILCRSKIILLDEATASVDPETSAIIDYTIREEFPNCTIIIIAHRLQTVVSCDRVLVIENGKIIEFDKPRDLISNPNSKFSKMLIAEETSKKFYD